MEKLDRRKFIKLVGGGIIVASSTSIFTGCSSKIPNKANFAWQEPHKSKGLAYWVLSNACLAPSSHNLQSWVVDLKSETDIVLYCDTERLLPKTDPYYRQIMISQGTFLELLRISSLEMGYVAKIELFPEGEFEGKIDNRPIANIKLEKEKNIIKDPLFDEIKKRRTNKNEYFQKEIPSKSQNTIIKATNSLELKTGFILPNDKNFSTFKNIVKNSWKIELETPHTLMESYKWLRIGPDEISKYRDGISINSPFLRFIEFSGLFDRTKIPNKNDSAVKGQIEKFNKKIDSTFGFFYLASKDNSRTTQVKAGMAYLRNQLAATKESLYMHPVSQSIQEYPEMKKEYKKIHDLLAKNGETIQMFTRIGYGKEIEPSPRRGLKEILKS